MFFVSTTLKELEQACQLVHMVHICFVFEPEFIFLRTSILYRFFLYLHFFRKLIFFREWENVLCHQLEGFSWAKAENQDQVRCILDNRVFRISHGRFDLKQHEETQLHKKAVTARAAQPDIRTALSSQTDCQRLRALIIHVLDIVVNGQSFAFNDSACSARGKYKQCFPIRATLILNMERRKQPIWQFT